LKIMMTSGGEKGRGGEHSLLERVRRGPLQLSFEWMRGRNGCLVIHRRGEAGQYTVAAPGRKGGEKRGFIESLVLFQEREKAEKRVSDFVVFV